MVLIGILIPVLNYPCFLIPSNDKKDHSLQISMIKIVGRVDSINYEKGDVLTFYPSILIE